MRGLQPVWKGSNPGMNPGETLLIDDIVMKNRTTPIMAMTPKMIMGDGEKIVFISWLCVHFLSRAFLILTSSLRILDSVSPPVSS